jgi:hypothetical protein
MKSAGREANAPQGLAFALLGLHCFLLASGRRRQKTDRKQENTPHTAQKNKVNVLYRPA